MASVCPLAQATSRVQYEQTDRRRGNYVLEAVRAS
jgi:hypothetical protein